MSKRYKGKIVKGTFLPTGIIAQYCDTTTIQVSRWVKNGDLKAFRTPGGQYRITLKDFRDFLERHKMPIVEDFFEGVKKKKRQGANCGESVARYGEKCGIRQGNKCKKSSIDRARIGPVCSEKLT